MGTVPFTDTENGRRLILCTANRQGRDDGIFSGVNLGNIIVNTKEKAEQFPYTGEV